MKVIVRLDSNAKLLLELKLSPGAETAPAHRTRDTVRHNSFYS